MTNSVTFLVCLCTITLLGGIAPRDASAEASGTVSRITLPVDQKLVGVSWRCGPDSVCAPWFLTRLIGRKEGTRSYAFTDGARTVLVTETRYPGNWRWNGLRTLSPAPGQRLRGVSWRCGPDSVCAPWFLTSPLGNAQPRSYVLTDGTDAILIHENGLR